MSDTEFVSRSEFLKFATKHDEDMQMIKDMFRQSANRQNVVTNASYHPSVPLNIAAIPAASLTFRNFIGVIPHPLGGRSSLQSSFVNVGAALKKGINEYNTRQPEGSPKIATDEFDGSLLRWSRQASSTLDTILGKYSGLNSALGQTSLERAQHLQVFSASRSGRFNKERSGVIEDLKTAFPVLTLAKANWAAYELLRNKFANAKSKAGKEVRKSKAFNEKSTDPYQMQSEKDAHSSGDDELVEEVSNSAANKKRNNASRKNKSGTSTTALERNVGTTAVKVKKTIVKNSIQIRGSSRAKTRKDRLGTNLTDRDAYQENRSTVNPKSGTKRNNAKRDGMTEKSGSKSKISKNKQQLLRSAEKSLRPPKNSLKTLTHQKAKQSIKLNTIKKQQRKAAIQYRRKAVLSDDEYSDDENVPAVSSPTFDEAEERNMLLEEEEDYAEDSDKIPSQLVQEDEDDEEIVGSDDDLV